jgi:hypothetical protein
MIGELAVLLAVRIILTALPAVAVVLFASRRGVREVPILLAIGLAVSATVGLLGFWSFFLTPMAGKAFSYFVLFGSVMLIGWCLYDGGLDRPLLRQLGVPVALWTLGSAFLLFLGFAHGGTDFPLPTGTTRFSPPLPGDSFIPSFYADWFFLNGHNGTPPVFPGEWQFSDRPPLQAGYVLSQRTFGWDAFGLNYQVLGVVLQQLWIVGLWALLLAARVGPLSRGLAMIAVLLSDLAILNGFFVWPKLLPAALLLAAAALVITPLWEKVRRSLPAAALVGALCGLAMMGHGSSAFGILPLAAVAAWRGLPSWRWLGAAAGVGALLVVSWAGYQKYDNPPGDRVTKWSLAGVIEIDDRGTLEATIDSYREAGFGGTIHNKGQNFVTMAGGGPAWQILEEGFDKGGIKDIVVAVRSVSFLYMLPMLGLLLLGPIAMALRRGRGRERPAEWRYALTALAVFGLGLFAWGLIVFGNASDRTVIHISSYMLPILAISACVVGLRSVLPRFAIYWVALDAALTLAIYVPYMEPTPGTSYEPFAFVISGLALAGFCFLAIRSDRQSQVAGLRRPPLGPGQRGADPGQAAAQVGVAERVGGDHV